MAVESIDGARDFGFRGNPCLGCDFAAQHSIELIQYDDVIRIAYCDGEHPASAIQGHRQDAEAHGEALRHQVERGGGGDDSGDVDIALTEIFGPRFARRGLADESELDEVLAERFAVAFLLDERDSELILAQNAAFAQYFAELTP